MAKKICFTYYKIGKGEKNTKGEHSLTKQVGEEQIDAPKNCKSCKIIYANINKYT